MVTPQKKRGIAARVPRHVALSFAKVQFPSMTDQEIREKHNDATEITRRDLEVSRIQKHGACTVFDTVEGPKFDFKNPSHSFFVYEISTKAIPPTTDGPPAVRITQCFGDAENAVRYARALNQKVGTTVFVGRAHEWHVSPDTLQDAEPRAGAHEDHRDYLLAEHARNIAAGFRNTKIREYIYKHHTPASTREWCESARVDKCFIDCLSGWAEENGFTFDRIGTITDAEAQELGVPGPYIRECYNTWYSGVKAEAEAAVDTESDKSITDDPPAKGGAGIIDPDPSESVCKSGTDLSDPIPEDSSPDGGTGTDDQTPTSAGLPLELKNPAHNFAVVSVVLDHTSRCRHIFKLYGVFAEKSDAETYIRNVAGVVVKDHDMYVVDTCAWLNFEHKVRVGSTIYRDPELNKIVNSRATQEDLIKRLQATDE